MNGDHHKAQVLLAILLRHDGDGESLGMLGDILEADPLDHWARHEMMLGGELTEHEFLSACRNDAQTVLEALLPFYVNRYLYQLSLSAKASEHSARMVAMKTAKDNANSLLDDLTLEYNKARQAAITQEILEIAAGQAA